MIRFIVCLLFSFSLYSQEQPSYVMATFEGDPSGDVENSVSAITGQFYIAENDLVVAGMEPIALTRSYLSASRVFGCGGWELFPHLELLESMTEDGYRKIHIKEPNGVTLSYSAQMKKHAAHFLLDFKYIKKGMTNTASGELSARTNLKNHIVSFHKKEKAYRLVKGDGSVFWYQKHKKKFLLDWEQKPSGNKVFYTYDKKSRLLQISSTNPKGDKVYAWAKFHYSDGKNFRVETSDGKWVEYSYYNEFLEHIRSSLLPAEHIQYEVLTSKGLTVLHRRRRDKVSIVAQYYQPKTSDGLVKIKDGRDSRSDRVKCLKAARGDSSELKEIQKFFYHIGKYKKSGFQQQGRTDVFDAYDNKTEFVFSKRLRLEFLSRFQGGGDTLLSKTQFVWSDEGLLLAKHFYDETGARYGSRTFEYDPYGNVKKEKVDDITITYAYTDDGFNSIKSKTFEDGTGEEYQYLSGTNLVTEKLTYGKGGLLLRESYEYDDDHLLIGETLDDFTLLRVKRYVPKKQAPALGFPEMIEDHEGKVTKLSYSDACLVTKKEIFDSTGAFQYALTYEYNEKGQLILERDALGRVIQHSYDDHGNKIFEEDEKTGIRSEFTYDHINRLQEVTSHFPEGEIKSRHFSYNLKNEKIAERDHRGHEISYRYDARGLPTEIHDESMGMERKQRYDLFGREVLRIDPEGNETQIKYSFHGQPTEVIYPDGYSEKNSYDLQGNCVKSIARDGAITRCSYDSLGRILTKRQYGINKELLNEEEYVYQGLQLFSEKDATGLVTHCEYDHLGRIERQIQGSAVTSFGYDAMGRLNRVTSPDGVVRISEFDVADRVTRVRKEDGKGNVLTKAAYEYDAAGNKTRICEGTKESEYAYDSQGRVIQSVEFGEAITFRYEKDEKKITEDPLKIETYDLLGRLISVELENRKTTHEYDKKSNVVQTRHFSGEGVFWLRYEYDCMGQVTSLLENGEKVHRFAYSPRGDRASYQKPDGTMLNYEHDGLGRITKLISSDGTVDEHYEYDGRGFLRSVTNRDFVTFRSYDIFGNLIEEKLGNGLVLSKTYDASSKMTSLKLPNGSGVFYEYDLDKLTKVIRKDAFDTEQYRFEYGQFDLNENPGEEILIGRLGRLQNVFDRFGRKIETSTGFGKERIEAFDRKGYVSSYAFEMGNMADAFGYIYDDEGQLIEEDGLIAHQYSYDGYANRNRKDGHFYRINPSHELLCNDESQFMYDQNGNPLSKSTEQLFTEYKYDALDRLIEVSDSEKRLVFTYDPWHRRLSKTLYQREGGTLKEQSHRRFLYDGLKEIGSVDQQGNVLELRILGRGQGAEIGSAVALEMGGQLYQPLHDLFGNPVCLIDARSHQIVESARFSAFGEGNLTLSPWGFQSKRKDPDTGLILFGRRYYDPEIGRFLTPDPIGYSNTANLYAFARNNPLAHLDLYGFSDTPRIGMEGPTGVEYDPQLLVDFSRQVVGNALWYGGTYGHIDAQSQVMWRELGAKCIGDGRDPYYYKPSIETIGTISNPYFDVLMINGIHTSRQECHQYAKVISEQLNDMQVSAFYNPTSGPYGDVGRCFSEKSGYKFQRVNLLQDHIVNTIDQGKTQVIIAHSEGGLQTYQAVQDLGKEYRDKLMISTFGSPKIIPQEFGKKVNNFISKKDLIPMIDVINYQNALRNNPPHVTFLESNSFFPEHSFMIRTYQGALKDDLSDKKVTFGL